MQNKTTTQLDFEDPIFIELASKFDGGVKLHRKQWELISCYQTMLEHGMLQIGKKGLVFGVGKEQLPALFAGFGCDIVATDQPEGTNNADSWRDTNQHCAQLEQLFYSQHLSQENFNERVSFRAIDANNIPQDLYNQFDFIWSICALEHFGSIQNGIDFILNSCKCLKSGGVAFHTTEYNCSSNTDTQDNTSSVFFRQKDLNSLVEKLRILGYSCEDINYSCGDMQYDRDVFVHNKDTWPEHAHLKVQFDNYLVTCVRITIEKP